MKWLTYILVSVCFLQPNAGLAKVRLPALISDGMILQRDQKITIWGWANPSEKVTITFDQGTYSTTANTTGIWRTGLPAHHAGGPYALVVQGENKFTVRNILFGDVWLCSGQSNMEYMLKRSAALYTKEIAQSDNPQIKQFLVRSSWSYTVKDDVPPTRWLPATPANVLNFSAVAYFFARSLYEKYHIPIGLINSSYGGTPAESWISQDALKQFPDLLTRFNDYRDTGKVNTLLREYKAQTANWYQALNRQDTGHSWAFNTQDSVKWQPIHVPGFWEDQGLKNTDGAIWYKREITVPAKLSGKDALMNLGFIYQEDSTYFNGKFIGNTTNQYLERRYRVPGELIKAGKNKIIVRIVNKEGNGGFLKDKVYELNIGDTTIPLAGQWQYRVGAAVPPLISAGQKQFSREPAVLYNSMIAPLTPYRIKGILWYQGESNTAEPKKYAGLFDALISDWRDKWAQGNLPWVYAQLANYMPISPQPKDSHWAELREAQSQTLKVTNTAMAVLHDTGEWNDVHPTRKREAGERLALAAQHIAYNENIIYSGPVYQSAKTEGQRIIISFKNIGDGLIAKGGSLKQFAIAGADRKFVWANAEITGDKVVVWSDSVPHPVAVRYAWADNPEGANLYNNVGLPASLFRTDDW